MTGRRLKMPMMLFLRSRLILALTVIAAVLAAGPLIYSMAIGFSGINLLYVACHLHFYVLILMICSAFEFFIQAKDRFLDETLIAATGGRPVFRIHQLFWQLTLVCAIHLLQLVILLAGSLLNDGQTYFLGYLWKPFLINLFLPSLIGLLLAFVLAGKSSRLSAYGFLLLFLLLVSPYAENFVWSIKPEGFPVDQVFNYLRWPFTILYQNQNWAQDYQYGLQTEDPRLQVQLFWLFLLAGLSPLVDSLKRSRINRRGIAFAAVVTAVALLALSYQPASLYRLNHRWDGLYVDFTYYDWGKTDNSLRAVPDPGFQILKYTLAIDLNRDLDVSAGLDIQLSVPARSLDLTLYRGYRVSGASSENGQPVAWTQSGDLLTLTWPEYRQSISICLQYSGHCQMLYSNSEAAMLPGYFPWYPMAGNRQIFIDDLSGYGYNPYNRIDPATVNLTVTGIRQLVTNLQQIGPGRYAGRTDGISLFAGQILPANDAMIHSLLPLAFDKTRMSEYFLTRMRNSLDQALDTLASVYGLDTSVLIGKPVLHPSFGLSRNYQSNQFAVFQDYILISTDKVKAADIMKYYLTLQPTKTGSYLADLFVNSLCDKPEQCLANMYKLLELQESSRQMAINLGKSAEQYDARLALREPLIEAVRQVGELKAVQAMIAYVLDSGKPADDQLFLKQLTEGTSYEIGD